MEMRRGKYSSISWYDGNMHETELMQFIVIKSTSISRILLQKGILKTMADASSRNGISECFDFNINVHAAGFIVILDR